MADSGKVEPDQDNTTDDFEDARDGTITQEVRDGGVETATNSPIKGHTVESDLKPSITSNSGVLEEIPLVTPKADEVKSDFIGSKQLEDGMTEIFPEDDKEVLFNAAEDVGDATQGPVQQEPPKRKLFGWLSSRSGSNSAMDKGTKSPPPQLPPRGRGATTSSILSNGTSHGDEDSTTATKKLNRISLKDQFKLVRLREEAGIVMPEDVISSRSGSPESGEDILDRRPSLVDSDIDASKRHRGSSGAAGQPTINFHLPPGTAAGTVSGPAADTAEPVDWDLWQEVVYEGPAAVARTSADELNRATMRGIPSAIRGVVWQVLANSKNEELETVYRELVARGKPSIRKPSDLRPQPGSMSKVTSEAELGVPEKSLEGTVSNRSSTHSEMEPGKLSRPNSGGFDSPATSQDGNSNIDAVAKEEALAATEEKKALAEQAKDLQKLERAIRRDLGARTSYSKFVMSAGLQEGLFGICKAYALFDEEVGYAQGMNFIAMPLLFNMTEEEAFCLFVRLMSNYNLRDLFIQDMPGLHLHLYQFDRLLEDLEPAVYCHLHRRSVTPHLYATQWFLTLFAYRFPLQLVLRIYDLILSGGLESAILKFGIVLVRKNKEQLLGMKDMATLTTFLKESIFDYYIDKSPSASSVLESGFFGSAGGIDKEVYRADALVQDACEIQITPEMLKTYSGEWHVKVQEEKQRVAAEEALKTANITLTQQVKDVTSRCEKYDNEHEQMASEIVRTKVDNQRLADENESLSTRVRQLEGIVEAQPGEVEDKLRHEMDRIMQRNIEVQNENRALEESTAEMENELVNAKMKYAEISAELDGMRRKWSSVTAMMSGVGSSGPAASS